MWIEIIGGTPYVFAAVQLHGGRLYGADIVHGIWVFDPVP